MSGHGNLPNYGSAPSPELAPFDEDVFERLQIDAAEILGRYPQKRSALLPLLHLVQSIDGYVSTRGIEFCAGVLDLTPAEVSGVATFYTQYKRYPNGEYTVGVCTNTLCAVMGGDAIFERLSDHLGIGHDETTPDGKITLERVECNAACDFAPVVMANWEFFDKQSPDSAVELVEGLRSGRDVRPTRGADKVCTFKEVSRVLAGFSDGRAVEGPNGGPESFVGLELARRNGWTASPHGSSPDVGDPVGGHAAGLPSSTDTPANAPGERPDNESDATKARAQHDGKADR